VYDALGIERPGAPAATPAAAEGATDGATGDEAEPERKAA
jgi:hypothetical protein